MFCDQCQNILNLDVLLSTHEKYDSNGGKTRPHPHHDSFAALSRAAEQGCEICTMVSSNIEHRNIGKLKHLTGHGSNLFFKFVSLDLLRFSTGHEEERVDFDAQESHEPGPALLPTLRLSPKGGM